MRVLYVAAGFPPWIGGVETISARLVLGLRDRGLEIAVLTGRDAPHRERLIDFAGVPVHRVDMAGALHRRDIDQVAAARREIAELARSLRPDLVHVAYSPLVAYYVLGARLNRVAPLVLSFHGWWHELEIAGDTLTRRTLEAATWITACSRSTLRAVQALDPGVHVRSSVIFNGLDESLQPPPPLSVAPPIVVGAGRLQPEKGFDLLLTAFVDVLARNPTARLLLAGDGPERDDLRADARRLGIDGAVKLLGWMPPHQMTQLLDQASVVAVPSRLEGFGLLALEAALRARPVVAAAAGGLPEVVEGGNTGILVPVEDATALADGICVLLGARNEAVRMGEAARERARRVFPGARQLDEHEQLYVRLAQGLR